MSGGEEIKKKLGLREAARAFNVDPKVIKRLLEEGAVTRDAQGKYDRDEIQAAQDAKDPARKLNGKINSGYAGDDPDVDPTSPDGVAINTSKAKKEFWLAEQAKIKAEKAAGILVERELVEASAEAIGSALVTGLRNLVPKLKPYMTDAGKEVLQREIDAQLRSMGDALERMVADQDDDDA